MRQFALDMPHAGSQTEAELSDADVWAHAMSRQICLPGRRLPIPSAFRSDWPGCRPWGHGAMPGFPLRDYRPANGLGLEHRTERRRVRHLAHDLAGSLVLRSPR